MGVRRRRRGVICTHNFRRSIRGTVAAAAAEGRPGPGVRRRPAEQKEKLCSNMLKESHSQSSA